MTLNEWEQSNIEVLTSREMGEWLGRRENRLLDKIRAEIAQKIVIRPALNHSRTERDRNDAFLEVLDIIDKYRKEQEDNGFFDEIMDDESEDGETYEKIKEIIEKVKEQEE